jgi:hypothetical protein
VIRGDGAVERAVDFGHGHGGGGGHGGGHGGGWHGPGPWGYGGGWGGGWYGDCWGPWCAGVPWIPDAYAPPFGVERSAVAARSPMFGSEAMRLGGFDPKAFIDSVDGPRALLSIMAGAGLLALGAAPWLAVTGASVLASLRRSP